MWTALLAVGLSGMASTPAVPWPQRPTAWWNLSADVGTDPSALAALRQRIRAAQDEGLNQAQWDVNPARGCQALSLLSCTASAALQATPRPVGILFWVASPTSESAWRLRASWLPSAAAEAVMARNPEPEVALFDALRPAEVEWSSDPEDLAARLRTTVRPILRIPAGQVRVTAPCDPCRLDADGARAQAPSSPFVWVGVPVGTQDFRVDTRLTCSAGVVDGATVDATCTAPQGRLDTQVLRWTGATALTTGVVLFVVAAASSGQAARTLCFRGSECPGPAPVTVGGRVPAAPTTDLSTGGIPMATLGASLVGAGGAWFAGSFVAPRRPFWTAVAGVGLGVAAAGMAEALR